MVERVEVEYGMSLEDYVQGFDGRNFEIIDGEVVFMSPKLPGHGFTIRDLLFTLHDFLLNSADWEVISEQAFASMNSTRSNWIKGSLEPDIMLMRKADVQVFKAKTVHWRVTPFTIVPPLVIEVLSATDPYTVVLHKINQYLAAGVQVIWLIDPFDRVVKVYRVGQDADHPKVLKETAVLTAEDLLPGFSLSLADLFNV